MISSGNCNCSCLIHKGRGLWTLHPHHTKINPASPVLIHPGAKQCVGGISPSCSYAKKPVILFHIKEIHPSVPPPSVPSQMHAGDGFDISKCCASESPEPVLDGPDNDFYFVPDNIFCAFDENQNFNERYQPIEEPWLPLPSVLPSSFPAGDTDVSNLMDRDDSVDVTETNDSLDLNPSLGSHHLDAHSFFKNVKVSFAGGMILESGDNFSYAYQPVEEPWLLYPAIKSVNADVSSTCQASPGEQSLNHKQNLMGYQEDVLQVPEKMLDDVESRRQITNASISTEILINSSICSMQRIAVLEDGELVELLLEPVKDNALCGSVYLGVVKRLVPQMNGAFVEIGSRTSLMAIDQRKQPFVFPPFRSSMTGDCADGVPSSMMREQLGAKRYVQELSDDVEEPDGDAVAAFRDGPSLYINGEFADHDVEDDIDADVFKSKKSIVAEESTNDLPVNGSCLKYEDSSFDSSAEYSWADVREGTKIIVQVVREGLGRKGPFVTPYPKLKSRFWVLSTRANNVGLSRNISGVERTRLRVIANTLKPPGFGLIARTVADGHSMGELRRDLEGLLSTWKTIIEHARSAALAADEGIKDAVPVILHQAMGQTLSVVQDYFNYKVKRMVVDSLRIYHEVTSYLQEIAPDLSDRVELHSKKVPLFREFSIEDEINNILNKRVALPDGGSLVIEQTEALVSIDVNGGHKVLGKGSSQEKAALDVNLAAAKQITRELRLRDIGGIIVVDFIDMHDEANKRLVYEEVLKAVERDRSPVQVCELSKNGLMEITRKRVRPSVTFMISEPCLSCNATGRVEALETSFSKIEHEICRLQADMDQRADPEKPKSWPKLLLRVDVYMCEYLTSGKRTKLATLCSSLKVWIILKVARSFTRGAFELQLLPGDKAKYDNKNVYGSTTTAANIAKFLPGKLWRKDTRLS